MYEGVKNPHIDTLHLIVIKKQTLSSFDNLFLSKYNFSTYVNAFDTSIFLLTIVHHPFETFQIRFLELIVDFCSLHNVFHNLICYNS